MNINRIMPLSKPKETITERGYMHMHAALLTYT